MLVRAFSTYLVVQCLSSRGWGFSAHMKGENDPSLRKLSRNCGLLRRNLPRNALRPRMPLFLSISVLYNFSLAIVAWMDEEGNETGRAEMTR
jgi:hypothetical protein